MLLEFTATMNSFWKWLASPLLLSTIKYLISFLLMTKFSLLNDVQLAFVFMFLKVCVIISQRCIFGYRHQSLWCCYSSRQCSSEGHKPMCRLCLHFSLISFRFFQQYKIYLSIWWTQMSASFYLYFQRVKIASQLSISISMLMSLSLSMSISDDETLRGMCTADDL